MENLNHQQFQIEESIDCRKDSNFVKEFRNSFPRRTALQKESPWAWIIFDFLKTHMDHYNSILCSSKVLEEHYDISRVTVSKAIRSLKKHKFIKVTKSGTSNLYYIDSNIVWSSWANQKKYAEFSAKVIVSESEQKKHDKIMKEMKTSNKKIQSPFSNQMKG